jgi:hypothetical protein
MNIKTPYRIEIMESLNNYFHKNGFISIQKKTAMVFKKLISIGHEWFNIWIEEEKVFPNEYTLNYTVRNFIEPVERILVKYSSIFNPYETEELCSITMNFDENIIEGKKQMGKTYFLGSNSLEYLKGLDAFCNNINNAIMPILEGCATLNGIHNFINNPPCMFSPNIDFFYPDGGTLFRKMIIAKLVNKDYKEVCDFVFSFYQNLLQTSIHEDHKAHYLKSLNCYTELKKYLDNRSD